MATYKVWDNTAGEWKVVIGNTYSDPQYVGLSSAIDLPKSSADTIDDDFDSTTLNGRWTVVDGTSGTVDNGLASTGEQKIYDLTSVSGFLAMQPHRVSTTQNIELRQDYTLGVGESVVIKMFTAAQVSSNTANEVVLGVWLNDSDAAPGTGGRCFLAFTINTDGWEIKGSYTSGAGSTATSTWGDTGSEWAFNGAPMYLRFNRLTSTVYSLQVSLSGNSWTSMKRFTSDTTFSNIWIRCYSAATIPSNQSVPIQLIDYIRLGSTDLKPW
tara:strand:- start:116 stop:922 length:807 start_codon:yes stop_codon:yes gene_type:complete